MGELLEPLDADGLSEEQDWRHECWLASAYDLSDPIYPEEERS
jgi:hypothetical protein